jgi:hypothetical protein
VGAGTAPLERFGLRLALVRLVPEMKVQELRGPTPTLAMALGFVALLLAALMPTLPDAAERAAVCSMPERGPGCAPGVVYAVARDPSRPARAEVRPVEVRHLKASAVRAPVASPMPVASRTLAHWLLSAALVAGAAALFSLAARLSADRTSFLKDPRPLGLADAAG